MATNLILLLALTAQGIRALAVPALFQRQAACYNGGGTINDGDGPFVICTTYCEHNSQQITGPPQTVSDHLTCDTDTCPAAVSNTYTSTQSFSINIGGDSSVGDDTVKGGASVGVSWSWSSSTATSDTYTFTLKNGDAGNIVFRPYYHQSCGDMKYFSMDSLDGGDGVAGSDSCDSTAYAEDTNACGQTPVMNGNFADGDFTFCYTDGPNKGKGC